MIDVAFPISTLYANLNGLGSASNNVPSVL